MEWKQKQVVRYAAFKYIEIQLNVELYGVICCVEKYSFKRKRNAKNELFCIPIKTIFNFIQFAKYVTAKYLGNVNRVVDKILKITPFGIAACDVFYFQLKRKIRWMNSHVQA